MRTTRCLASHGVACCRGGSADFGADVLGTRSSVAEGENPLYLRQAKTFDGCAALGPGLFITDEALPPETEIHMEILRGGAATFVGSVSVGRIRRPLPSLVKFLFHETGFPDGCFLFTGTGTVPPDHFTLAPGDEVRITIPPRWTLVNLDGVSRVLVV